MPAKSKSHTEEAALTKRERQLMDIFYRREQATAREALADLPDAPSYSTVRTLITLLVKKGQLLRITKDRVHLYRPARQRRVAAESALRRLVRTFYNGSVANAVSGLLSLKDAPLSAEDISRLEELISNNKKEEEPK